MLWSEGRGWHRARRVGPRETARDAPEMARASGSSKMQIRQDRVNVGLRER